MKVKALPNLIFSWIILILLGGTLHSQAQATYHVPLGSASSYGLLSASSITAQDAVPGATAVDIPIQVLGKVGASQAISPLVTASAGRYTQEGADVAKALAGLQAARSYCSSFYSTSTGQISSQLAGQTLRGGVYNIAGDAVLGSDSPLTLTGDTSTIIIVNVTGSLTMRDGGQVVLNGVVPQHLYWNVTGKLTAGAGSLQGIALLGGAAQMAGLQVGYRALLSQGAIGLSGISASAGHNKFHAANAKDPYCAAPNDCPIIRAGNELVADGSFEANLCLPTDFDDLDAPSFNCFWQSATQATADYFYKNTSMGAAPNFNVPQNYFTNGTSVQVPALAQNSQNLTGKAYAGIHANTTTNVPGGYREYAGQTLRGQLTPGRYYGEFSAHIAPISSRTVPLLGMALVPTAALPITAPYSFGTLPYTPVVSGSPNLPPPSGSALVTPGWKRVGQLFEVTTNTAMSNPTLIIGNFSTQGYTQDGPNQSPAALLGAYYYIDNASLSRLTEAGPNVAIGGCGAASATLGTLPMPALVGATYQWVASPADNSLTFASAQSPNPTVQPLQTTTYTLYVTINGTTFPLTPSSQVTVTVTPGPAYSHNAASATYVAGTGLAPYEIGTYGTTTVLNAGGGTISFDGKYHVRGTVKLTNGTFQIKRNTIFYVDGASGLSTTNPTDSFTAIVLEGSATTPTTLTLTGATLRANTACVSGKWQGVVLNGNSILRTAAFGFATRSVIRDANIGVRSSATNSYYLNKTTFINNGIGLYDVVFNKIAQAGEGATECIFRDGDVGIWLFENDYGLSQSIPGGNYDLASYASNTFESLTMGLRTWVNNGHLTGNTFAACATAISATGIYMSGPTEVRGNTITVPAATTVATTGIALDSFASCTGNVIGGTSPLGGTYLQVGISSFPLRGVIGAIRNNTLHDLDEGISALLDGFGGMRIELTGNRLTDNATGMAFYPLTSNYAQQATTIITCNSFIDNGTVSSPVGIWVKSGAIIASGLGGTTGNGNEFQKAQWIGKEAVKNNNAAFTYTYLRQSSQPPYYSDSEYVLSSTGINPISDNATDAANFCKGGPGVNSRQLATNSAQTSTATSLALPAYPNPATSILHVPYALPAGASHAELVAYDALGRQVLRQAVHEAQGEISLSIQNWTTGLYQLILVAKEQVVSSQRVAINH